MILSSKILTLNKQHILDKIYLETGKTHPKQIDYYTLGYPIINPPRIRGSIILQLNKSFLIDNQNFFGYGSPIDIGSIKYGYFKPPGNTDKFIKNMTCNYQKFIELINELEKLPDNAISHIINHERALEARPILLRFFDRNVVDFMFSCNDPHAWMLEFSLQGSYLLRQNHIKKILYPNTYSETSLFTKLSNKLFGKTSVYNPKYGIEGQWI
jgi:hypothetical protein